jgi:hypothetical protein
MRGVDATPESLLEVSLALEIRRSSARYVSIDTRLPPAMARSSVALSATLTPSAASSASPAAVLVDPASLGQDRDAVVVSGKQRVVTLLVADRARQLPVDLIPIGESYAMDDNDAPDSSSDPNWSSEGVADPRAGTLTLSATTSTHIPACTSDRLACASRVLRPLLSPMWAMTLLASPGSSWGTTTRRDPS